MTEEVCVPAGSTEELNRWLGRREAFSLIAGRCSAADVECIRRIRDGKLYLSRSANWDEFCENELHMCKSNANRLIALLKKFGPEYFYISQVTRISPAEYRAIAPAISAAGIESAGEVIPLTPENSERVAAVVAAMRARNPVSVEPALQDRLADLDAAGDRLLQDFRHLRKSIGESNPYLSSSIQRLEYAFHHLVAEVS